MVLRDKEGYQEGRPENVWTERQLTILETGTNTMTLPENTNRRTVLKTVGAGVAGGVALAGNAAASPQNNFGYVEDSTLEGETVTLMGTPWREKVFCDAGGSESRIKTQVWDVEEHDDPLYLIPSGYNAGDTVMVGEVFTFCTRNDDIKGEVSITKE